MRQEGSSVQNFQQNFKQFFWLQIMFITLLVVTL